MSTRSEAGKKARRHGQDAEYECIAFMRDKCGRTVHRVKRGPYDLVWWNDLEFGLAQVKSYLLGSTDLQEAEDELAKVVAPP